MARAEAGQRDTLYDLRRLFELVDAVGMPREALVPLLLGSYDEEPTGQEDTEDMSINRRQLGGGLVGLAAAASVSQFQVPAKIDLAHVRYLHSAMDKLYTEDQSVGGGALVRNGLRVYHRARRMLDEAQYSEVVGHQLMSTVGELAVCVGWLAYDANDQSLARELYSDALLMAGQSGDDGLAIRAMEKMSLQSACAAQKEGFPGSAREALRFSERASELARRDPCPQLHALLASRVAIAHAVVGDRKRFTAAISLAWREVDRGFTEEAPTWLGFVNSSEIKVQEARGRLFLGEPIAAADLYRESLDSTLSSRNSAAYRAQLAAALAASGDTAGAIAESMVVLPALGKEGVMSPRTLDMLLPVRRAVAGNRIGNDFCSRYDRTIGDLAT